jgi:hypothetical protein
MGADGLACYSRNFPVSYDECPRYETANIRHHVIGASYWFPGGFGQSHIWDRPDPITNRPDLKPIGFLLKTHSKEYLDNLFRSLMMTGFGFGTLDCTMSQRISRWHPDVIEAARRNIAALKKYRHLLSGDVYHISPQRAFDVSGKGDGDHWDAIEYAKRDQSEAVAFFFRSGSPNSTLNAKLKGLHADTDYTVTSLNTGERAKASGSTLMERGTQVNLPEKNTSEILLFHSS